MKEMLAYEVYELNNGSLYLVCYKDAKPVFIGGGYEYRPGDIKDDIEAFMASGSVNGWDGNQAHEPGLYDEITENEMNLICGNDELLPENMGTNGKNEFLKGAKISFRMRWDRAFSGTVEDLEEWWYGFPYDCEDDDIEASEVKVGGFNVVADTVCQLMDLLGI